jgi:proteasome lid subunit RPN8/RPN11
MTSSASPFSLLDLPDPIREAIYDHVFASDDIEVGGVLVGDIDEQGKAVVHGMIAALQANGTRASVTFTHDAWKTIIAAQERDFPDSPTIVGWYHSHPGFGIFLSEHDVFIQENFFSEPYQVAYVVDPQEETEGVFGWSEGKLDLIEQARTPRRRGQRRPSMVVDLEDAQPAPASNGASPEPPQRSVPHADGPRRRIEFEGDEPQRRRRGVVPLVAVVALLGVGVGVITQLGGGGGSPPQTVTVVPEGDPRAPLVARDRTDALSAVAARDLTSQLGDFARKVEAARPKPPTGGTGGTGGKPDDPSGKLFD